MTCPDILLSCHVIPYRALPYPAVPRLALFYPTLSYPCHTLSCLVLSYTTLSYTYRVFPCSFLSCPVIPLACSALFLPILPSYPWPVKSCLFSTLPRHLATPECPPSLPVRHLVSPRFG
ncbi:hypothetical protein E2C01_075858 [Portunus trituberculatus]|uniref:Uncharacterized protein n=1 Tax=Portunus trituberculatus TaxID=210409 RepID=A0A5B7I789_PORTR|nr:hypothetical protein [Portunus trituberculatus]